MSRTIEPRDFFVVGGPLQPDRACYVRRAADDRLPRAIAEQRFTYVLSPRATGKSSLMARTIRRLRGEGQLAAVIDLTQIGARGEGADSGRWYYSIAYRILRELRLKVDLQAWWHDRSALLNEQRLVEFFWDVVLANTTAPVTVFFDEAERAIDLPFSDELFVALRSCYMRRVSEPDYGRLNFVVLGVATPEQLCADASLSPFTDGVAIELEDFTREETHQLAAGFGQPEEVAHALLDRIHTWTCGQPYLTQKVARGVARRGGKLAHVDKVVRDLLLMPGASQEEPLLNHIRTLLSAPSPANRQALMLLGRIAKGGDVVGERRPQGRAVLVLAGLVRREPDGTLAYRNPVFEQVFDGKYARAALPVSVNWHRPVAIAAAAGLVLLLPYWYTQVLPRPYIDTLNVVSQDYELANEAYVRLHRLPGFAGTAERLLADAMVRRSEQTVAMSDVLAADAVLRSLPNREALADEMFSGYWLRQAQSAMHRGERDPALVYAIAALDGRPEEARRVAAELIGLDYPGLESSFRLGVAPLAWEVDWARGQIVVVDETHRVHYLALPAAPDSTGAEPSSVRPVVGRLTAVEHVAVERELQVSAEGTAGAFNLLLTTQHSRASDLMLRLRAPSGASVEIGVPQPRADQQLLIFSARPGSALAALSSEPVAGQWELSIVDRRLGESGMLTQWGLQFAGSASVWEDEPEQGIALPDPTRTEQVDVELGRDGRMALAVPSRLGAAGAMSVWDLETGELAANLEVRTLPDSVRLLEKSRRVIAVAGDTLTLWDIDGEDPIASIEARDRFVAPPVASPDERFIEVAEAIDDTRARLSLLDAGDGRLIASVEGNARLQDWVLGPEARYLVVLDGARRGRILDPRTGEVLADFLHQRPLARLIGGAQTDNVVAVDVDGAVVAWPLRSLPDGMSTGESVYVGQTADAELVSLAPAGGGVSFTTPEGMVSVRDARGGADASAHLIMNSAVGQTRLGPDSRQLVSARGSVLRLWRLDASPVPPGSQPLDLSAVALDGAAGVAALGFRGGHVRTHSMTDPATRSLFGAGVDYIAHRGPVTSLAINAERGVLASGGSDGVVRLWDLASVAPNDYFLRHPSGAVTVLGISRDARWLASGAGYSARVWRTDTGELANEIPVDGTVQSLSFSPDGGIVAVGDSAGNIFLGAPRGTEPLRAVRARAAVMAIAFSDDASVMASGDRDGELMLWDVLTAEPIESSYRLSEPVSWIAFVDDDRRIEVKSGPWVHALERTPSGLIVRATRLLPAGLGGDAVVAQGADGVLRGLAGAATGRFLIHEFELEHPVVEPLPADSPLLERDWPRILGLELDPLTGSVRPARSADF